MHMLFVEKYIFLEVLNILQYYALICDAARQINVSIHSFHKQHQYSIVGLMFLVYSNLILLLFFLSRFP